MGWTCSGGTSSSPSTCLPICGDGMWYGTEECDDGHLLFGKTNPSLANGDGCDFNCKIENLFDCRSSVGSISSCRKKCGNGYRTGSE